MQELRKGEAARLRHSLLLPLNRDINTCECILISEFDQETPAAGLPARVTRPRGFATAGQLR